MARESEILQSVVNQLSIISGIRVYPQVLIDKWNTYQFDYAGVLACEDNREVINLEDDSALANKGTIDIYILSGVQTKKQNTGKANLREKLANLSEEIEWKLHNFKPPMYNSDFETTYFSPLQFVSNQVATYSDDETKGISLSIFRSVYYRGDK
jgi:hypothetical protein